MRRDAVRAARELANREPCLNSYLALGTVELAIGQTHRAARAFELATQEASDCDAAWNDWGSCLAKLGEFELASQKFSRAASLSAQPSGALANWGSSLLHVGSLEQAEASFLESFRLEPGATSALGLCRTWARLGRDSEALDLCGAVLKSNDAPFQALDALLELKLDSTAYRLDWATRLRSQHPQHSGIRALHRRALRAVNLPSYHGEVESVRQHIHVVEDIFENAAARERVASRVENHTSFQRAPSNHATRGGWHSGDLFQEPEVSLQDLEERISRLAQGYLESRRSVESASEFVRHLPKRVQIHAWAVRLEGPHYQELHFHPEAWASGCLYLEVPETINDSETAGHLYFDEGDDVEPLTVTPQLGRAVMFPSCMDHGTLPFVGTEQRLSVAFDVIAL